MDAHSAASAYAQNTFESAPPLKIVHMMYEGAIRFLEQAEALDPAKQPGEFTEKLNRTDAIVSELRLSLEPQHAPELCERLNSLYLFVEGRIRESFLERSTEPLSAARNVLETLLEGWKGIQVTDAGEPVYGETGS